MPRSRYSDSSRKSCAPRISIRFGPRSRHVLHGTRTRSRRRPLHAAHSPARHRGNNCNRYALDARPQGAGQRFGAARAGLRGRPADGQRPIRVRRAGDESVPVWRSRVAHVCGEAAEVPPSAVGGQGAHAARGGRDAHARRSGPPVPRPLPRVLRRGRQALHHHGLLRLGRPGGPDQAAAGGGPRPAVSGGAGAAVARAAHRRPRLPPRDARPPPRHQAVE